MQLPIYLDYSATTPVDPRVADRMIPYLVEKFGNPASRSHPFGWEAEKAVEDAREQVAALVNADPKEIIWTSGATESNNLAIKGAAQLLTPQGNGAAVSPQEESEYLSIIVDEANRLNRVGMEHRALLVRGFGKLFNREQNASFVVCPHQ